MKIRAFITHKLAERYSDCQDYFIIRQQRHSVAVADGMSQSIFPKWWAEELARAYTDGEELECVILELQQKWRERVDHRIKEKEEEQEGSSWRIIDFLNSRKGAGSTLCGITFEGRQWSSYILGDTSLIIVGPDFKIKEIVNTNKVGFTNHPDYFDSITKQVGIEVRRQGELEENAYLLIVSDPLGELLELKHKAGEEKELVEKLVKIESHKEFIEIIEDWRNQKLLHNDDTTCVVIEENGNSEFQLVSVDDLDSLIKEQEDLSDINKQLFSSEIKTSNSRDFEDDNKIEGPIINEDSIIFARFINSLIQLFQNEKRVKRREFNKLCNHYPSLKELIKKY